MQNTDPVTLTRDVECAILSWHAVMAALKGDAQPVTTESEQN